VKPEISGPSFERLKLESFRQDTPFPADANLSHRQLEAAREVNAPRATDSLLLKFSQINSIYLYKCIILFNFHSHIANIYYSAYLRKKYSLSQLDKKTGRVSFREPPLLSAGINSRAKKKAGDLSGFKMRTREKRPTRPRPAL
jgi:hypothetical protein